MNQELDFRRVPNSIGGDTHQVAKWAGYAHGGPQYHALASINGTEIVYSIYSIGPYWYLHFSDDPSRYEVFDRKRDAVAFAQADFNTRWPA